MTRHAASLPPEQVVRPAFVMPMVILALVVVSLGVGVSLTRFAAETKVVERQVRAYHEHHAGMGLQEAIGAWMKQQNGRDISDAIDPLTGHAMDIELADGSVVSVLLRDGQGTALADLSGIPADQVEEAGIILKNLAASVKAEDFVRYTRSVGPSGVSINTAPEPVLRAIAQAIAGNEAETLVTELIRIRSRAGKVTRQDITTAVNAAGLTNDQRVAALRLFSTDVELWAVVVELRGGRSFDRGRLLSRYGGLARLRVTSARRGNTSNLSELGSFLTWKDLGIEGDTFDLQALDER